MVWRADRRPGRAPGPGRSAARPRDIDARFHSLFIANTGAGLKPIRDAAGLKELAGRRFTFGSESSTSGRLEPERFLRQAGVTEGDFRGRPGFSGSHDATIDLVTAGSYEAGALNEQVWQERLAAGKVDRSKVRVLWRTPAYHDYYWLARPDLDARLGAGFTDRVRRALLGLDDPKVLRLFAARRFVGVGRHDHDQTVTIARDLGLLEKAGA